MATNYPSGLDSLSNPAGSDALSTGHASQHANANDAIEAIEGELGLNPRGGSATVKARFDAIEANSWVTSARIADGTITGTDIASGTVTSTNILDGTIVNADINASAAIDVSKLSGVVSSASVGNLLTANQASFETDLTGWNQWTNNINERDATVSLSGSASLKVTDNGAGVILPYQNSGNVTGIVAGQTYTAVASFKSAAVSRQARIELNFRGSSPATVTSAYVTTTTSGWTQALVTGVAPAGVTGADVTVRVASTLTSEVHYIDCVGLWKGAGGLWALPGTPIANLGTYTDETVGRRIFTWDTVNSRWQMSYGDTGDRNAAITYTNNWANSYGVHRLRRIGNTVYLVAALDSTNATADAAFTVPSGFRPTLAAITAVAIGGGSNVPRLLALGTDGVGTIYRAGMTPQGGWQLTVAYPTNEAWPTSLPGTASGSIPT